MRSRFIVLISVALTLTLASWAMAQDKPPKPKKVPAGQVRGQPQLPQEPQVGVYIWSDKDGVHIRWTTGEAPTLFEGRIDTDKPVREHKRLAEHGSGYVEASGDRIIMFSSTLRKGVDGIDFKAPGSKRFQLELKIDGKEPQVEQVHFGKKMAPPKGFPLLIYI